MVFIAGLNIDIIGIWCCYIRIQESNKVVVGEFIFSFLNYFFKK
ncbi:hypothetical protein Q757_06260 [Oenococcus alcoholitolerans]|uniref:Uncharacterized protein n=1 Tax=Oenococcus alcoholitolerans TaxID=931074 RepID=A0ABR4XQ57_9LACO|nr:hypothetical protein Q757_06260 [Oenococcus alcoholitolerans]